MKGKKADRSSNFELLRVTAMFMIIVHHLFVHCINVQLTDTQSIARMGNGYFCHPVMYERLWLADFGIFLGPLGNAVFVLISGYFMVQKEKIDMTGISRKLLSQLAFACMALVCGSFFWYRITEPDGGIYTALTDISSFNSMSWYVGFYFTVILTGRLFLNRTLASMDALQYAEFLAVLFALIEFGWTGSLLEGLVPGLRTLCTGVFLYALAGYIRKYDPFGRVRLSAFMALGLLLFCIMCLSAYNVRAAGIENFEKNGGAAYIQALAVYRNWHIFVLAAAVLIFELFRRMRPFRSRFVNFLGGSTFMIYLLHDNKFFYSLWGRRDWIRDWHESTFIFAAHVLMWAGLTFTAGAAAYVIYLFAAGNLNRLKRFFLL